jgi:hypothetical protein
MNKLMNFLILSCDKATELIEKKQLFNLSKKEKIQLKLHKGMCAICAAYEKQSHILNKLLQNKASEKSHIIENEELKNRIINNLKNNE